MKVYANNSYAYLVLTDKIMNIDGEMKEADVCVLWMDGKEVSVKGTPAFNANQTSWSLDRYALRGVWR